MAVLNRKLFNRGGPVSSRGVGITSGLVPVQKFQEGGKVSRLGALSPALLDFGGRLLASKSLQSGVTGGLDILGQSLSGSAPSFAEGLKTYRAGQEIADRKTIKGADGYQYYLDGTRVLPDVDKEDETDKIEQYQIYEKTTTNPTPKGFEEFLKKIDYIKTDDTDPTIAFQSLVTDDDGTINALFVDTTKTDSEMLTKIDTGLKAPPGTDKSSLSGQTFEGADKFQYQLVLEKNGNIKAVKIPGQGDAASGTGGLGEADIQKLDKRFDIQKKLLTGTLNATTQEIWTEQDLTKKLTQEYYADLNKLIEKEVTIPETKTILSVDEEIEKAVKLGNVKYQQETAKKYFDLADKNVISANTRVQNIGTLQAAEGTAILGEFQPTREYLEKIFNQFKLDNVPALAPAVKFLRENFINGEAPATDVAKAMINLGTLANAENGALPGNLNQQEIKILQESYPQLFNSPEGFKLLTELYRRDAVIDQLRSEAVDAYRFSVAADDYSGTGELSGTLFPEGKKVSSAFEATVLVKRKLAEIRQGMLDGFDEESELFKSLGWENIKEDLTKVQSYGKMAASFKGLNASRTLPSGQVFKVDLDERDQAKKVTFIGYSNEESKIMYDGKLRLAPSPNVAMYAVESKELNNDTGKPVILIYGFQKGGKK